MTSEPVQTIEVRAQQATSDAERRARLPAWLCSVVLHAIIFVAAGIVWQASERHGVPGGGDRPAGIALTNITSSSTEYYLSSQASESQSAQASDAPETGLPNPQHVAATSSSLPGLPSAADATSSASGSIGLPTTGELLGAGQPNRGSGGNTLSTRVFGAEGTGSKFVYVFDRSASMGDLGGRPLKAAKHQLIRSLQQFSDIHQFQIVFYNEQPYIFNPNAPSQPRLLYGDDQSKRLATRFVEGMTPVGGTNHWDALRLALNLRPDVVFFLTDGTAEPLSPTQLAQIQRTTDRRGTAINVIEFGSGPARGSSFLKKLAQQNGGQYVYVDVTTLQVEASAGP